LKITTSQKTMVLARQSSSAASSFPTSFAIPHCIVPPGPSSSAHLPPTSIPLLKCPEYPAVEISPSLLRLLVYQAGSNPSIPETDFRLAGLSKMLQQSIPRRCDPP
jgi:hypothetical protein